MYLFHIAPVGLCHKHFFKAASFLLRDAADILEGAKLPSVSGSSSGGQTERTGKRGN